MTPSPPSEPPESEPADRPEPVAAPSWLQRRRDKIVEEIERNRRGGHKVPTWVLVLILVAFVAAWASVILVA